jgi:hypothetical protein
MSPRPIGRAADARAVLAPALGHVLLALACGEPASVGIGPAFRILHAAEPLLLGEMRAAIEHRHFAAHVGFSATPEFPQIEEAQALLATLA